MAVNATNNGKIRMITYLHPGLPLGLFQTYQYYLEEVLGRQSQLVVESRWSCPPSDRPDPLTTDEVDVAFMCSSGYLSMTAENNKFMELCKAAPVFRHDNNLEGKPIYYSDVVIRKEREDDIKEFIDLKGHRWAINDEQSLSGNIITLVQLKRLGYDTHFFGDVLYSGSHHKSVNMVLSGVVDGAAVDSNCLRQMIIENPDLKNKLKVVCSWGPLPIYPIVLNSRLPAAVKQRITQAFLHINQSQKYQEKLDHHEVIGFVPIDHSIYDKEKELVDVAKGLKTRTVYY